MCTPKCQLPDVDASQMCDDCRARCSDRHKEQSLPVPVEPVDAALVARLLSINNNEAELHNLDILRYTVTHTTVYFYKQDRGVHLYVRIEADPTHPWSDGFLTHVSHGVSRVNLTTDQTEIESLECIVSYYESGYLHGHLAFAQKLEPGTTWHNVTVQPKLNQDTFDRMSNALTKFSSENDRISEVAKRVLAPYGEQKPLANASHYDPDLLTFMGILDESQQKAVRTSMKYSIIPIQGPPGTGKTTTMLHILFHLVKNGQRCLVAAQSNQAVYNIACKIANALNTFPQLRSILKTNEFVYCAAASARGKMPEDIGEFEMETVVERRMSHITQQDERTRMKLYNKIKTDICTGAKVVACTVSVIGGKFFSRRDMMFDSLLLDEAGQINVCAGAMALVRIKERVVLMGDTRQLPPFSLGTDDAVKSSMLSNCIKSYKNVQLKTQYRMHPFISSYINNIFYAGQLCDGVSAEERASPKLFADQHQPSTILAMDSTQEEVVKLVDNQPGSYFNRVEVDGVMRVLHRLLEYGIKADKIGVITFYSGQHSIIRKRLDCLNVSGIESSTIESKTVDGFQGREKDYIIISCVRTRNPGFSREPNRVNVSLSRARRGQIIVMNRNGFINHGVDHWDKLHEYHVNNNSVHIW